MKAFYSVYLDEFVENLKQIENNEECKSVLILMTDDEHFSPALVDPVLQSFSKSIIGGVFSEIIVRCAIKSNGVLLLPLPFDLKCQVFSFDDEHNYQSRFESNYSANLPDSGSIIIFADAFVNGKSQFIESLYDFFGNEFNFIGGGSGTSSFKSSKNVVHNSGMHANAAVIGLTEESFSIGIAHGWNPITKPMKATEVELNEMKSINWEPAFDVYKQEVEEHSGLVFDQNNFFEIAKSYPIGLIKIDGETVIRDPFKVKDTTIHFLDLIDSGQYFSIMHGDVGSLLAAASEAKGQCMTTFEGDDDTDGYLFCIDCSSRGKFLEGMFAQELKELSGNQTLYGALTFGEIANVGDSFLEIYNKTVIVAKWK